MKPLIVTLMQREPSGKARLFGRALQSHFNIEWPERLDHLMLNGGDDYSDAGKTVTGKYNAAREVFLAGDYSHMLTLEHDMVVPSSTLQKLTALESDIAYGLYVLRHKIKKMFPLSACTYLNGDSFTSLSEDVDAARALMGGVLDVQGVGLGCTLIARHVLEELPFRYTRHVNCDWCLALDAQYRHFSQRCDTSLHCEHMSIVPSPGAYLIDMNAPQLYRWQSAG